MDPERNVQVSERGSLMAGRWRGTGSRVWICAIQHSGCLDVSADDCLEYGKKESHGIYGTRNFCDKHQALLISQISQ